MKISAVILTKNEEENIGDCIKSLGFCNEVVVIDDNSEDRTREIANKMGARVFIHPLDNNFAAQRNFGLKKTRGEWVLFVDADESVPRELADEITNHLSLTTNHLSGFYLKRRDIMWGRELRHGETGNIKFLRLAKNDSGIWKRQVHEFWDIKGKVGIFNSPLLHYPHPTIEKFVSHLDFYSTLHAQQKFKEGQNATLAHILFWPRFKFLKNWILLGGFLDGTAGFVVALMMSFHSFLAWSKLWLLKRK